VGRQSKSHSHMQDAAHSLSGLTVTAISCALALSGCSARDPVTETPVYHVGTPTNRSTTYSWVPHNEPFYVQPGLNSGKPLPPMKSVPSELRFEPYDPLATAAYNTIKGTGIDITYITTTARDGVVIVSGAVASPADKVRALSAARTVTGVRQVIDQLKVE